MTSRITSDGIRAVVLDAGGVLLLPAPDSMREALAPFGVAPDDERCRRAHYAGMREVDRLGEPDWPKVDLVVAREAGVPEERVPETNAAIESIYRGRDWTAIRGAAEALVALQAAGFDLAIVSNAEGTMEEQLATHEICSVDGQTHAQVAIVVDSTVVGVEKPDPRIFDYALEALGLPASACLYVGDSVHFDVQGARAAGLHPVHLDPFDLCESDGDHAHVRALGEVVAALTG